MKKKIIICSILIIAIIAGIVAIPAILHKPQNEVSANGPPSGPPTVAPTEPQGHPEYMAYDTLADFLNNDDFDKYWYFKSENYDLVTVHKKIVVPILPNEYGLYELRVWGYVSFIYNETTIKENFGSTLNIMIPCQYMDTEGKDLSQILSERTFLEQFGKPIYNKKGVEFFVNEYDYDTYYNYNLYTLSPINDLVSIKLYNIKDRTFVEKFIDDIQFRVIDLSVGVKGDINGDYETDIEDLLLLKKHTLKLIDLTGDQLTAADLNDDGKVDVEDLLLLKKIILKIE